jgi:hypothetical protein
MSNVRIPKRLKQRPLWRGLPIPYVTLIRPDGQPDFRVTDEAKRLGVIRWCMCQLCGQPLGKHVFFVGGTASAINNAYFEPACHLDCLIYAMQVCPFIVGKMEHADTEKIRRANPDVMLKVHENFAPVRNPLWVIVKADGWTIVRDQTESILIRPSWVKSTVPLKPDSMTPSDWKQVFNQLL